LCQSSQSGWPAGPREDGAVFGEVVVGQRSSRGPAGHPLCDDWHKERSADLSQVTVPLLSCANWEPGHPPARQLHGFLQASSPQKWLEVHGESHWALFSSGYGHALQKKFFDHFLKGLDNGWDKTPPVTLNVRHPGEKFVLRHEHEWRWPARSGRRSISIRPRGR